MGGSGCGVIAPAASDWGGRLWGYCTRRRCHGIAALPGDHAWKRRGVAVGWGVGIYRCSVASVVVQYYAI